MLLSEAINGMCAAFIDFISALTGKKVNFEGVKAGESYASAFCKATKMIEEATKVIKSSCASERFWKGL